MNKIAFILLTCCLALSGCQANADQTQMQQLAPDVARSRITDKTYTFSRSQLKYGLQRTSYLSRWVDQPLFVDPALDDGKGNSISYPSFVKMAQIAREYGLDGFAFFPRTSGRYMAYDYAKRSAVPGFHLLSELTSGGPTSDDDVAKMSLDCPQSFRLKGKVVFTSYRADNKPIEYWQKVLSGFRAKYGDKFIFLPDVGRWDGQSMHDWQIKYHNNKVTAQDVAKIKDYLGKWARATDGIYFAYAAGMKTDQRTFDTDFYQNFVIRLMKSVLAEPEFKNKYLGLSAVVGHENVTRFGVTLSSDGTGTLRHSLGAAMSAYPDIINIPEWDEQNENTSLRPTVYNGTSSMRIMRYFTSQMNEGKLSPLPGDNTNIPDLIISYRKLLVLGEKLELELLNVPDSAKSVSYTAQISLETVDGKTVYTSPVQSFSGDKMEDHTLTIPSETLSQYEVLRPKVVIDSNGHKSTYEDGLHYIDLRSTWNWDYKWVKEPLRDVMSASKVLFQVSDKKPDGARVVTADIQTDEPLARVQVLDNDDIIYEYNTGDNWRENANQVVLSFQWQALRSRSDSTKLKGGITLKNATGHWSPIGRDAKENTTQTVSFAGQIGYVWPQRIFLSIPKTQASKATLKINMPGIYQGTIPVQQILDDGVYGIPAAHSFNMVISRYVRQDEMQKVLNTKSVHFTVPVLPDLPTSVLHLQAIGVSGHIYRSKPVALGTDSQDKESITVYSDTKDHPVSVQTPAQDVPDIRYEFNPKHGSVLVTDAGRPFWGILGGYFALATARGGGESGDATPFIRGSDYPADAVQSAPTWVKTEDGKYALQFDGKGTYITLPQDVIPRRAAFTIAMDIKPDTVSGRQVILANRSYYPGSFTFYLDNGVLKANYLGVNSSKQAVDLGISLPVDKWSHLVIRYDQKNLTLSVDSNTGKKIAVKGPGIYDTASVVGGFGKDWFKGQIKSLEIKHGVAPKLESS